MKIFGDVFGTRRKLLLGTAGFVVVILPVVFAFINSTTGHARSQAQNKSATELPRFEYEVASIKPDQSDHSSGGMMNTPDGLTAANASLKGLIQSAFGVLNYQISGGPDWLTSERYVIDAKMDAATADALQKLSREDRGLARQQMLRALLTDRLKLTVHRETKELPVYFLVIAKNGPKLQQAKPDDTYPNGFKGPDGIPLGGGVMSTNGNQVSQTTTAQGVPIADLARSLSGRLSRAVLDRTGLTGKYDFTLNSAVDRGQFQGAADGQPPAVPPDAPFLFEAIQQQLGLRLESGKGPVEIIVIDHVERPAGN